MKGPSANSGESAGKKIQLAVEVMVVTSLILVMLYAIIDAGVRKSPVWHTPAPPDCEKMFSAILAGEVLAPSEQQADACAERHAAMTQALSPKYSIDGAAIRSKSRTISLYGAAVARTDANSNGRLGKLSIPTVVVGHGTLATEIQLHFPSEAQADKAFIDISATLSKLK
jgi:hypothetical protein